MIKVRMLVPMASPEMAASAGREIEISSAQAREFIGRGYAELVEDQSTTEPETPPPAEPQPEYENTVKKRGKPRKE